MNKTPVVTLGGQVVYALQPKQLECYMLTPLYLGRAGKEHIGYGGAAGGAKSHTSRAIATAVAGIWRGSTTIIFRKTEGEVLENHYQKFRIELPSFVHHEGHKVQVYTWNGKDLAFTFPFFGSSRILLGHLQRDDDVFKYQGNEYDCIVFEESTHYTWFMVSWLSGNRLRATVPGSIPFCLYPSNPGNVGHQWYKRLFITHDFREGEDPEKYAFVQARLSDNQELLKRDPGYARRLDRLPEPYRSWQRDGDFEAGAGSALPQLRRKVHLVDPFPIPDYWIRFGAFDWGYQHPFSFGEYAVTEDGDIYKLQTVVGRHLQPHEIAERIKSKCDVSRLRYIDAGRDVFHYKQARGENTPTIAEQFKEAGIILREANVDRIHGLQNLRAYLAWENTGPNGGVGDPGLRLFDNESNRKCFEQLEAMVPDPDNIEDVLKVDADEMGEGGDDMYDETRYAIASRPRRAPSLDRKKPIRAFAPEILKLEQQRKLRPEDRRDRLPDRRRVPIHPEFGEVF